MKAFTVIFAVGISALLITCNNSATGPGAGGITLTASKSIPAAATIVRIPDRAFYKTGDTVEVIVVTNLDYMFTGWTGDTTTSADTLILVMNAAKTIHASFSKMPDGVTWTKRSSGVGNGLVSAVWAGPSTSLGSGQIVVAGNGIILSSSDAITWTDRTPAGDIACLNCVIWTGSLFVCVGDEGTILTSTDGQTWEKRTSPTTYHLQSVVWTGNQFVAVGGYVANSASSYDCTLTSPDGITWTNHSSGSGVIYGITWTGNKLVAVGYFFNYSTVSDNSSSFAVVSDNGTGWTQSSTYIPRYASLVSIIWTGSTLVAVGGDRNTTENHPSSVFTSSDGNHWTETPMATKSFLNCVAWTGTSYVAVGKNGTIFSSQDAAFWTERVSGTADPIYGVTWTGSQLVAVGYGGLILTSP